MTVKGLNFIVFRSHALQSLSLLSVKRRNLMTKDDIEAWIKKEYQRHLKKEGE